MTMPSLAPTRGLEGLRRRWTLAFVMGELVGFVPPAVVGATLASAGASDLVLVVGLTLAGSLEGAAIGVAQALVLARYAPHIDNRDWVVATAAAAGFAWFVGMGGGALMGTDVAPPALLAALLTPAWGAALIVMGCAQWRVLRRTVSHAKRWVWVVAGAWLIGVTIPVAALSSAPDDWPGWVHAGIGVLAAVAMGFTVGAITARTLERLLSPERPVLGARSAPPDEREHPLGSQVVCEYVDDVRAVHRSSGNRSSRTSAHWLRPVARSRPR